MIRQKRGQILDLSIENHHKQLENAPARRHAHARITEPLVRVQIFAKQCGAIPSSLQSGGDRVGLPLGGVPVLASSLSEKDL
jgi:hypothetical protein